MDAIRTRALSIERLKDVIMAINTKDEIANEANLIWDKVKGKAKKPLTDEDYKVYLELFEDLKKKAAIAKTAISAGIKPGLELGFRNEATSVMADLLGISDMMMKSTVITVDIEGKQLQGLRMDKVEGVPDNRMNEIDEYKNHEAHLTPKAFDQFMKLQVLDIICGQVDRNYGNYMFQSTVDDKAKTTAYATKGKVFVESLVAIDNDMAFGTLSYNDIVSPKEDADGLGKTQLKSMEDKQGNILIPALDSEFAEKILAIRPEMLELVFGRMLTPDEVLALKDRLKGVQQVIQRMKEFDKTADPKDKLLLSTKTEWEHRLDELEKLPGTAKSTANSGQKATKKPTVKKMACKSDMFNQTYIYRMYLGEGIYVFNKK